MKCCSERQRERLSWPLQRSKDNGVIPNQIHKAELKKILENAEKHFPFLKEKDENGKTVTDKLISIFEFRIPYYVGPLSDRHKDRGANVWIVRKEEGRIYPWNFDDKVDREKSNEAFIDRMTNKCTYLTVRMYCLRILCFTADTWMLNELNNLR